LLPQVLKGIVEVDKVYLSNQRLDFINIVSMDTSNYLWGYDMDITGPQCCMIVRAVLS